MELLSDPAAWASLLTLTALEVVLGIDNLIFLSIVVGRLPKSQQVIARNIGLAAALGMRVALLASIVWIASLTAPILTLFDYSLSWRDIILLVGGGFLIFKGTLEIHHTVEGPGEQKGSRATTGFVSAIVQIMLLDLVFSLDSVITAVGMADHLSIMIAAVVIAMAVMVFAAGPVSRFIERHPTAKMLALSFLLLVGMALVADGLHFHIPKGYLYFAIAFSILVEALNLAARSRRTKREKALENA